jgi:tripartite-type tricarboxylate transporter receptor subunit TctC
MPDWTVCSRNMIYAAFCAFTAAFAASAARAQSAENFYRGKTITIIVSSDAGGGFDAYSRMLARHLTQHIPGTPGVVVQNMPGAASLTAVNYIANVAPRDGTVFSDADSTIPFYTLLEGENSKFDAHRLNWIGSINKVDFVCVAYNKSSFKTIDDAMQRPMRVSGSGGTAGWRVILPRLYNLVAGTKFEVVMGYAAPEAFLAMERGEVDGTCPSLDTLLATKSDWLRDNRLTFLTQFSLDPAPGFEKVPLAIERVKDPGDRAAMNLFLSQQLTGRPYVAPPDVPPERLQALHAAFDATMKDPEFLADAKKMGLPVDPLTSDEMKALLDKAYATSPEIVARTKALYARAAGK